MNMLKFDPFFRDVDRLTQRLWGAALGGTVVPVDAWRDGDNYIVEFDVPGVSPDSIDVTVDHGVLTVQAQRPELSDGRDWLLAERAHGQFSRQLKLSNAINADGITAEFTDGVLRLTIPLAEGVKPRKIAVAPSAQQAISA
jgi:HSP20 family protein